MRLTMEYLKQFKEVFFMKEMRRVLALVLCLVMLIGIVPAAAFATEESAEKPIYG